MRNGTSKQLKIVYFFLITLKNVWGKKWFYSLDHSHLHIVSEFQSFSHSFICYITNLFFSLSLFSELLGSGDQYILFAPFFWRIGCFIWKWYFAFGVALDRFVDFVLVFFNFFFYSWIGTASNNIKTKIHYGSPSKSSLKTGACNDHQRTTKWNEWKKNCINNNNDTPPNGHTNDQPI